MKKPAWVMSLVVACLAFSVCAEAGRGNRDITVEIVDSHGAVFRQLPAKRDGRAYRAYLEAERDARYRIRVHNSTGERLGVVVTVDGRNIISGARSELANDEPMYILDAWGMQEYSGWRANLSEVNEFYFTDWKEAYAEAFGDRSARGVIAVAVYREKESKQLFRDEERRAANTPAPTAAEAPVSAPATAADADRSLARGAQKAESSQPGTGYGDRRVEHAVRVAFDAEHRASQRVFLKYEWREALCGKRLLDCDEPANRFWPNDRYGFAPPPPGR